MYGDDAALTDDVVKSYGFGYEDKTPTWATVYTACDIPGGADVFVGQPPLTRGGALPACTKVKERSHSHVRANAESVDALATGTAPAFRPTELEQCDGRGSKQPWWPPPTPIFHPIRAHRWIPRRPSEERGGAAVFTLYVALPSAVNRTEIIVPHMFSHVTLPSSFLSRRPSIFQDVKIRPTCSGFLFCESAVDKIQVLVWSFVSYLRILGFRSDNAL